MWLAGCGSVDPIAPPDSSGEGFGTTETRGDTDADTDGLDTDGPGSGGSTAAGEGSTSAECPAGAQGCRCLPEAACAEGLLCATDLCVPPGSCEVGDVGTEGCPCTPKGTCEAALICASDLCVMPIAPTDPVGVLLTHSDFAGSFAVD